MSENPYAPPKARVEDVLPPPVEKIRPRQIVIAVQLAALSCVLGIAVIAVSWDYYSKLQPLSVTIASQLFSLALSFWLYYKIYVGRNWARITLLVLAVFGAFIVFNQIFMNLIAAAPLLVKAQILLGFGINLVILALLFLPPGRTWFRKTATH
jgi:uncharacterized membrane protein